MMPHNTPPEHINSFLDFIFFIKDTLLGIIGGAVAYLLKYYREKQLGNAFAFDIGIFLINMVFGGFVAYLVGASLPLEMYYRDFIIGASGVASYQILSFIESDLAKRIIDYITKKPS